MSTSITQMWNIISQRLPKGEWISLKEIYKVIQININLDEEDFMEAAKGSRSLRWDRNVRNTLHYRKGTCDVLWDGKSNYMIPITKDEEVIMSSLPVRDGLTEEQFNKLQQRRAEVGAYGEDYILKREQEELTKQGRLDLANRVDRISIRNIGAGYDILSFDLNGQEKYIEVKSSISHIQMFELTANELKKAEVYGDRYWIYFVRNLFEKPDIKKIRSPFSKIGKELTLEPSAFRANIKENENLDDV